MHIVSGSMRAGAILVTLIAASFSPFASAQEVPLEYQVKGAFLYNFARFTEWPPDRLDAARGPFNLCIFGEDRFGDFLQRIVRTKTIHDREIAYRHVVSLESLKECDAIFFTSPEGPEVKAALRELRRAGVLTVGETPGFIESGGMIRLFISGGKVRFEINLSAVERGRLKVSSQVLKLARVTRNSGDEG